jgi:exodeoxyribonuclease VII large subunit
MLDNNSALPEFSVTEISNKIKLLLESNLGYVRIKGEISGLKIATSGHGYFSLKDSSAVLAATCWRHNLSNVKFKLSEGLEVVVTGKITAYAGQSKYQISVDNIRPAGSGAFMQILKERKEMLEKEGLFRLEHKQKLPFMPQKIGIVTSITGSVIRDIIHRISDRCPVNLIIWPVTVQGEVAAAEISNAINGFNLLGDDLKPDLIIVARGGGSIEDLWPFNEENVVRAAFNSKIPLISAVGHETDYTLIDLVADVRAPTPTAAAEFAVPVIADLKYTISSLYNVVERRVMQQLKHNLQLLGSYDRILHYPVNYLANNIQKIDELSFRLSGALPNLLRQKKLALQYFPISRILPSKITNYKALQLSNCANNLLSKKSVLLNNFEYRFNLSTSLLSSLDYHNVLKRGYAMIKGEDGKFVSSKAEAEKSSKLRIKLFDGELPVSL